MGGYQESLNNCLEAHLKASQEQRTPSKEAIKNILSGGSSGSNAGVSVTPVSAMRTAAVWACIRVLSFSLASLPLHVYKELPDGGKEKALNNPIYNILHRSPNERQTSFVFRMVSMANLCSYGNAYSEIQFDIFGNPIALWLIPPWCCEPMLTKEKELFYQITMPDTGEKRDLQAYRVLHVMGLGTDGLKGLSPIRQQAETIGISIATEQFGARFFSQGANVGGVVTHPGHLSVEAAKSLRDSLNEKYAGLGSSHRLILLEEAMKYEKVGIPPEEAQFLETRQFQIEDIARIYGVQLHKIGHLLHATFSNIEQQNIEFVTDTMLPWTVNWEMEYDRKLLTSGLYTKHSLDGLLRGDSAARAALYRELFFIGAISPDEVREKEEMNAVPGGAGNRYYIPANMIPADKVDAQMAYKSASPAPARSMDEAVKKISERDKANIRRAYQKDPAGFDKWLDDYYRDFPAYMLKEITGS